MNKEPVYYRKTEIKEFKDLNEGDCICELCNGWGYFYDCEDNKVSQCYHCRGKGKLDWITNITGVPGRSGTSGTSGYGSPLPPPQPPNKRIIGTNKVTVRQSPTIKTIPYKAVKKIPLKERFMNAVADK